jgi:hypothetical protein
MRSERIGILLKIAKQETKIEYVKVYEVWSENVKK